MAFNFCSPLQFVISEVDRLPIVLCCGRLGQDMDKLSNTSKTLISSRICTPSDLRISTIQQAFPPDIDHKILFQKA